MSSPAKSLKSSLGVQPPLRLSLSIHSTRTIFQPLMWSFVSSALSYMRPPMKNPTKVAGQRELLIDGQGFWSGFGFLNHHVSRTDVDFLVRLGVQDNLFIPDVHHDTLPQLIPGGPVPSGHVNLKHAGIINSVSHPGWRRSLLP